ncbi:putative 1-phosphatidylinositol-3-phosphate 5-kinase FAB1D isoform X2 [Malania oleifera]|uniref:putative 1-phosphatidylinositol-3-phosphate 5-kinase FAB1D isoform X2 n=1 Tax=Malania oleifera TaxID=397392 RepID=UPI0025ADAF66|nr:putative 1-phosphatidylinositol-3-phosphate 5-kinase FAB1D isoform X2 [Malania oleifera]
MCNMCQFCGLELAKEKQCNNNQDHENSLQINCGDPYSPCKLCIEKHEQESVKQDDFSPYTTPLISPTVPLSSTDSCVSSCSESSVDIISYGRSNQVEGSSDGCNKIVSFGLDGHLQNSSLATTLDGSDRATATMENNLKEKIQGDLEYSARDVEIISNSQEATDNAIESVGGSFNEVSQGTNVPHSFDKELDAEIWEPPEPEDLDDDMEGGVANNDDYDDECGDGTKWGKPSSLCKFGEDIGSYCFKEEWQKAVVEVMIGKLKALVGQLLKSVGVALSNDDCESWVDVVTCLSWQAASFVKPAATEGKAMDPSGYVKVKCIASGSRSQSQVIKGVVFKKHAAHKHMPTKYRNPRLLLIRGMLGQCLSRLSSFNLMEQEENSLNSVVEMIEMCHPNVVLVEKTVSRDVQEFILKKGITLVFDMKLHRLERIARCIGSPISSSDTLMGHKLKQCEYFHFEKFIEEHATSGEGGKRPSKTLMFLEGCPTRLGCTILLRGSHSDELKKIKSVVYCAFVMAYHLILETSFLADQRAMFYTIPFIGAENSSPIDQQSSFVGPVNSSVSCLEEHTDKPSSLCTIDIPISNGGSEISSLGVEGSSTISCQPYNPAIFFNIPYLQASLKKVIGNSYPLFSPSFQPLSSYFCFSGRKQDSQMTIAAPVLTSPVALDFCDVEQRCSSDEEKLIDRERALSSFSWSCEDVPLNTRKSDAHDEDQISSNNIGTLLDSQSILVLMSSRNVLRGTICEQSHFSRIKFYKNFDVPLGKFLEDNLLNQRHHCTTCGELPEAHFYYYAHHKKQLTIQVKRLHTGKQLPGEAEGKLWMWSRCGKCKPRNGISKSTKRVLISTAARGLSFGKFLEMSFALDSSFTTSGCGHSLEWDFLYFFGLGSMVAMFRYSPVVTYSVALPPQKLDFSNSIRKSWLDKEIENVHEKGILLFVEVENTLQRIGSRFDDMALNLSGLTNLSDIEYMLKQERSEFEVNIRNVKNGDSGKTVCKLLSLNRLLWELLLESCVWDRRLHFLLTSKSRMIDGRRLDKAVKGQYNLDAEVASRRHEQTANGCEVSHDGTEVKFKLETSLEESEFPNVDIPVEGPLEGSQEENDLFNTTKIQDIKRSAVGSLSPDDLVDQGFLERDNISAHLPSAAENCGEEDFPSSELLESGGIIPIIDDLGEKTCNVDMHIFRRGNSLHFPLSNLESSREYVWTPFSEIRQDCTKDLQRGYLPKFEPISSHTSEILPLSHQLISEEGSRLHICLGNDDFMVLDFEDELSSIIACALALLKDSPVIREDPVEDSRKVKGMTPKTTESSHGLPQIATHCPATGSLDSDGPHSTSNVSSEESRLSSFDGLTLLNSLVSFSALHPEVSLGAGKLPRKGKYSVICLYANQFHDLRSRCCPSELDYIASLSHCRNWDAKGGKSKSFFAKTLDDRFIIKEIKKTEFDSFMKFALDYFKHINQSFDSGSQTCLAKILGIYQVRRMKNGKEMKHDLMVMENLTFGREVTRQYDLKGALHARYNSAGASSEDVLLDQNFVNDMNISPLYVSNKSKRLLQRAVWNDTSFLKSVNVMDYSLLVVVDNQRHELVCGIIDYLRQYTWDKQLETWVKSSLVVPKHMMPTVISPTEYKKRFRKFMSTHFLSVPDYWCSDGSYDPCKLHGTGENHSSESKSQKQGS